MVCIDLDDSDVVDLSPQSGSQRASSASSAPSDPYIAPLPVQSATLMPVTMTMGQHDVYQPSSINTHHHMTQQGTPHPVPLYTSGQVSTVQQMPNQLSGTSTNNYCQPYGTSYGYYSQNNYTQRLIAQELRNFMINIRSGQDTSPVNDPAPRQSSHQPQLPRYS